MLIFRMCLSNFRTEGFTLLFKFDYSEVSLFFVGSLLVKSKSDLFIKMHLCGLFVFEPIRVFAFKTHSLKHHQDGC